VNGIALVKDLLEMRNYLSKITEITANFSRKTLRSVAAASSSTALECFYGLRLTTLDLKEVFDGIFAYANANALTRRRSAAGSVVVNGIPYDVRLGIYIPPLSKNFCDLRKMLNDFDFEVTPSNVWDLLPFSFVVDWIYPVQQTLERLELGAKVGSGRMQILYCIGSYKGSVPFPASLGVVGGLATVYRRDIFAFPPEMKLTPSSGASQPLNHVVEGMSLLVSGIL
jgi:hypothetical protein